MAYVDTRMSQKRYGTMVLVGAIELGIAYALIAGLAAKFVPKTDKPPITIFIPEDKPPPPPTDKPREHTRDNQLNPPPPVPTPENPFQNLGPLELPTSSPATGSGSALGEVVFPTPTPSPTPSFAARAPKAKGNPGLWVGTNDYPQAMIRAEAEGVVRFRLDIDSRGKVTGCTVTASSGFEPLDQATCAKLTQRARFEPASDTAGAAVAGVYAGAVRWQLPKD